MNFPQTCSPGQNIRWRLALALVVGKQESRIGSDKMKTVLIALVVGKEECRVCLPSSRKRGVLVALVVGKETQIGSQKMAGRVAFVVGKES